MGIEGNRVGLSERLLAPKVGIVGGTGVMGTWFGDLLERSGIEVVRVGRSTPVTPLMAARRCDVLVISVPIAHTEEIIRLVAPHLQEDKLLMDLTSVKKVPIETMLRYSSCEVVGLHPLFGVDKEAGEKEKVVICPGRGEVGLEWIKNILTEAGLLVVIYAPERHDELMGLVQGVNHFSTLALALLIKNSGFSLEEIQDCSTQTFMRRLRRISAMLGQSEELFGSLLMDNSFSSEFVDRYLDMASHLGEIIKKRDGQDFKEIFLELKDFFLK